MAEKDKKVDPGQDQVAISRRKLGGEAPIVVNEIVDGCLYAGMFGTMDSARMKGVVDLMLEITNRSEADFIIVDLSNVDIIDSAIAGHLSKMNKTLQMVGMKVIFCGIKPIVAQSMVNSGVDIGLIDVEKNLKAAIREVLKIKGLKITSITE